MDRLFMLEKTKNRNQNLRKALSIYSIFFPMSNVIILFVSLPFLFCLFFSSSPFLPYFVSFGCSNHATVLSFLTFDEIQRMTFLFLFNPPFKTKSWRLLFTFRLLCFISFFFSSLIGLVYNVLFEQGWMKRAKSKKKRR